MKSPDLLAIRRIADGGAPIPPWVMRTLLDRVEALEHVTEAAQAWQEAIRRCDGIAAAEERLSATMRELPL